eukprot:2761393-Lingulodinium_polyedra.AAC.1
MYERCRCAAFRAQHVPARATVTRSPPLALFSHAGFMRGALAAAKRKTIAVPGGFARVASLQRERCCATVALVRLCT